MAAGAIEVLRWFAAEVSPSLSVHISSVVLDSGPRLDCPALGEYAVFGSSSYDSWQKPTNVGFQILGMQRNPYNIPQCSHMDLDLLLMRVADAGAWLPGSEFSLERRPWEHFDETELGSSTGTFWSVLYQLYCNKNKDIYQAPENLFGIHKDSLLKARAQPSQDFDAHQQPQAHRRQHRRQTPVSQALKDFFDLYQCTSTASKWKVTASSLGFDELPRLAVMLALDHSAFFRFMLEERLLDLSVELVPSEDDDSESDSCVSVESKEDGDAREKPEECIICYCDIRPGDEYPLLCGHVFCKWCFFKHSVSTCGLDWNGNVHGPLSDGQPVLVGRGGPAGLLPARPKGALKIVNNELVGPLAFFYKLDKKTCCFCSQQMKPANLSHAFALQLLLSGLWRTQYETETRWNAFGSCTSLVEPGTTLGQALVCLSAAAGAVHTLAVLVQTGGVNLDDARLCGRNPLHYAARFNQQIVLHWLTQFRGDAGGCVSSTASESPSLLKQKLRASFAAMARQPARDLCLPRHRARFRTPDKTWSQGLVSVSGLTPVHEALIADSREERVDLMLEYFRAVLAPNDAQPSNHSESTVAVPWWLDDLLDLQQTFWSPTDVEIEEELVRAEHLVAEFANGVVGVQGLIANGVVGAQGLIEAFEQLQQGQQGGEQAHHAAAHIINLLQQQRQEVLARSREIALAQGTETALFAVWDWMMANVHPYVKRMLREWVVHSVLTQPMADSSAPAQCQPPTSSSRFNLDCVNVWRLLRLRRPPEEIITILRRVGVMEHLAAQCYSQHFYDETCYGDGLPTAGSIPALFRNLLLALLQSADEGSGEVLRGLIMQPEWSSSSFRYNMGAASAYDKYHDETGRLCLLALLARLPFLARSRKLCPIRDKETCRLIETCRQAKHEGLRTASESSRKLLSELKAVATARRSLRMLESSSDQICRFSARKKKDGEFAVVFDSESEPEEEDEEDTISIPRMALQGWSAQAIETNVEARIKRLTQRWASAVDPALGQRFLKPEFFSNLRLSTLWSPLCQVAHSYCHNVAENDGGESEGFNGGVEDFHYDPMKELEFCAPNVRFRRICCITDALQAGRFDVAELIFRVEREKDQTTPPKEIENPRVEFSRTAGRVWYERVVDRYVKSIPARMRGHYSALNSSPTLDVVASIKSHLTWLAAYLEEHVKIRKVSYKPVDSESQSSASWTAEELNYPVRSYDLWNDWSEEDFHKPLVLEFWSELEFELRDDVPWSQLDSDDDEHRARELGLTETEGLNRQLLQLGVPNPLVEVIAEDGTRRELLQRLKKEKADYQHAKARNLYDLFEFVGEKMGSGLIRLRQQVFLDGTTCDAHWPVFLHFMPGYAAHRACPLLLYFRLLTYLLEQVTRHVSKKDVWNVLLVHPTGGGRGRDKLGHTLEVLGQWIHPVSITGTGSPRVFNDLFRGWQSSAKEVVASASPQGDPQQIRIHLGAGSPICVSELTPMAMLRWLALEKGLNVVHVEFERIRVPPGLSFAFKHTPLPLGVSCEEFEALRIEQFKQLAAADGG